MSDEEVMDEEVRDEREVLVPPAGYTPGNEVLAGQNVGDRGEVIPSPEEILEEQRQALLRGGDGSANSPDTAAAGAEHEDR